MGTCCRHCIHMYMRTDFPVSLFVPVIDRDSYNAIALALANWLYYHFLFKDVSYL